MLPFGYYDLVETFPKPGCAVCGLLLRDVNRLLDALLYEYVVDPDTHRQFRASRGLCNEHGWGLTKLGNALGVAVLYDAALDELLGILQQSAPEKNTQSALARRLFPQNPNAALVAALEPTKPCAACALQSASETEYVSIISQYITDARLQDAYRQSEGLCLEHFQHVLRATDDADHARLIVTIQRDIWARLKAELAEFIRKNDIHHAHEPMGAEGNSWLRAVARFGGERGVFGVRRP